MEEEEKWAEGGWVDERRRGRERCNGCIGVGEKRVRRSGPTSRKTKEKKHTKLNKSKDR